MPHLVGYETLRTPFVRQTNLAIVNQFGTTMLDLTRRDVLMVPSSKDLMSTPPPLPQPTIDHFQCYRTKRAKGAPRFVKLNVTVSDQLENDTIITLVKPYRLCVPANKNGESPDSPNHPGSSSATSRSRASGSERSARTCKTSSERTISR